MWTLPFSIDLYVYSYISVTLFGLLQFYGKSQIREPASSNFVLFQNCFGSFRSSEMPFKIYKQLADYHGILGRILDEIILNI